MKDVNGFITIMSLTIMTIILLSGLYIMHTYSLEYMIINSTINSIQSSYLGESKLYLVLSESKYYSKLHPSIERFVKNYEITAIKNISISLDKEDLLGQDTYDLVTGHVLKDYDNRIIVELRTRSTQNRITRETVAKVTVLNDLYELGMPIVAGPLLDEENKGKLTEHMDYLGKNIVIPNLDKGIYGIDIKDFEKVRIINDVNNKTIECYRKGIEEPIRVEKIITDSIFLLCKDKSKRSEVFIMNLNPDNNFNLSGLIYIEGNLIVQDNFELNGIMVLKGNLTIEPSAKTVINGIMLYEGNDAAVQNTNLQVYYDDRQIRKYLVYLPKYIDLNIRSIKTY